MMAAGVDRSDRGFIVIGGGFVVHADANENLLLPFCEELLIKTLYRVAFSHLFFTLTVEHCV